MADGPRSPGYHPSVTGIRSADNRLLALVGQVEWFGPKKWWVVGPLWMLFPAQDYEIIFTTEPVCLPEQWSVGEWTLIADAVGQIADLEAARLNAIDPRGLGR